MSKAGYDAIIVGAGIVGAACADELARCGLRVGVIDRDVIGSGATAAGMGHIVVMDDSEPQFALTRYSQTLWQALQRDLPEDVEFEQCGTIWVAADGDEMLEVRRKCDYYRARGVPAEILDHAQLKELEPNLREGFLVAILVSRGRGFISTMRRAIPHGTRTEAWCTLQLGASVRKVACKPVLMDDGFELRGEMIINTAGAWSTELTQGIDVKKRKGHLVITDRYPGFLRHQLVELGYLKSAIP